MKTWAKKIGGFLFGWITHRPKTAVIVLTTILTFSGVPPKVITLVSTVANAIFSSEPAVVALPALPNTVDGEK